MSDLLQGLLVVVEAVVASVLLPPMAWLAAKAWRRSAAGRRLVWITAFAMLLGLPVLALVAPSLAVIALPAPPPVPAYAAPVAAAVVSEPAPGGFSWFDLIPIAFAVWLAGLAKLGVQHLIARVRLELMRREAAPWPMPTPIPVAGCQLLVSEDCPGPMTWGAFRPVIMLPEEALDWPEDRLATVLRHEMAHVRRRDGLAQALALIACALYWPNPLVWGAARALRREAELAADDMVIAAGVRPSDYAGQLLELAAEWRERRLTATGLAMAAPPALSQRVQSILSTDAIRTGATSMDAFKLVLLGGAATAALTLARPSVAEVPAPATAAAPAPAPTAPSPAPAAQPFVRREVTPGSPGDGELAGPGQLRRQGGNAAYLSDGKTVVATRIDEPVAAAPRAPAAPAAALTPAPSAGAPVPYNQVTDDPASPGYIPAGQAGAGHPVPAELAKLLNARPGGGTAPWTMSWLPNPNGPPIPPGPSSGGAAWTMGWIPNPDGPPTPLGSGAAPMTPEQRADRDRKMAAIGPAIDKAIKDAHIEETVRKALAAQDSKTREEVAKQLQQIGPRIQQAIAGAQFQLRFAQLQPQFEEARKQAQERQAQAEDRVAAQLEEQAKRARERAQRAREQLNAPQPAPAPAPKN